MLSTLGLCGLCLAAVASVAYEPGSKEPYPAMAGPFYSLVNDAEAQASIVLAPDATGVEQFAAEELATYVERISGARLPVVAAAEDDQYPILLGRSAQERIGGAADFGALGQEGFVLRSSAEGLLIAGASDLGTLYGVYHLLEKCLGVRWFMPGELGTVIPASSDVVVGTFDEIEKPDFRVRWVESGDWALHNRMNVRVEVGGKPVGINWKYGYHSILLIVPPDEYYDEHPEYFALVKGKRRQPRPESNFQVCTSNPELIEVVAERVCRIFDEDPDIDIISVCPMDGGGFCGCEACRALDEDRPEDEAWHASYSNRLAVFNNAVARLVAQRHPDKLIKVGAYAMYVRVPTDPGYRPEPNLAIQACHTYSCNNHRIAPPTCARNRRHFTKELERWAEITDHLFIYEYYNKGAWGGLPYPQVHLIREDIPYFRSLGVEGFYTQPAGRRFPVVGLNHYIAAKLVWDSELDTQRLLQDFYTRFYQESSGPMGRYWDRLERAFQENPECLSPFGYQWVSLAAPGFFTPEVLADCESAIAEAERLAQTEAVKQRVHLCRVTLDFTRKVMDYLRAVRAPFEGIDITDGDAVAAAHARAIEIGDPLSDDLVAYCQANGVGVYDRLVRAHKTLRFVMPRPDEESLLR